MTASKTEQDTLTAAMQFLIAGRHNAAEEQLRRILAANPHQHQALHQLGVLRYQAGAYSEAVSCLRAAIQSHRRSASCWTDLGQALARIGETREAERCHRRAVALSPDFGRAHYNLACHQHAHGSRRDARASFERAGKLDPALWESHFNLGAMALEDGDVESAVEMFQRAVTDAPHQAAPHFSIASSQLRLERTQEALSSFARCVESDPAWLHRCLREWAARRGASSSGDGHDPHALPIPPEAPTRVLHQFGRAFLSNRQSVEAEKLLSAARLRPNSSVHVDCDLALTYLSLGRIGDASRLLNDSIARASDSSRLRFHRSALRLLCMDLAGGWEDYESRLQVRFGAATIPDPTRSGKVMPLASSLRGISLEGKHVFVLREQGLGDELFFLRFARELKRHGARISVFSSPKLMKMLSRVPEIDDLVDLPHGRPNADVVVSVCDLPLLLAANDETALPPALELAPDPAVLEPMRRRLLRAGPGPYLGITWRAGVPTALDNWSLGKHIPPMELGKATRSWNGTVVSLQRLPIEPEFRAFTEGAGRHVANLADVNEDLESMLALQVLLDEYLGVSNTNMHLRAGLNKTMRVLVPFPPDWRWTWERLRSPWFPEATLYRESIDGWSSALARVTEDLRTVARTPADSTTTD